MNPVPPDQAPTPQTLLPQHARALAIRRDSRLLAAAGLAKCFEKHTDCVNCAAALAKRPESAAHCSLDKVAGCSGIKSASLFALKSSLQRFAVAAPIPPPATPSLPPPPSGRHRPCVFADSPQTPTAGDPCDCSLVFGFEAGGAIWNLACLLLATLVIAAC
jgi:hypothetical protein